MNIDKKFLVGCTVAMSMVPFYSHATSGQIGLEACTDALVSELSISNGKDLAYKFDTDNADFDRKLGSFEMISLYARDSESDELVSRMDCVVNGRGRVVRMTTKPLDDSEFGDQVTKAD